MTDQSVEQWGLFELALRGPASGNPFVDVTLSAQFSLGDRVVELAGFYDGDGTYRIRFMPDAVGRWQYVTRSNAPELDGVLGTLTCVQPAPGNHDPVRVCDTFYFAYEDGTPFIPIGTTCYAWIHQGDALQEQTLETLKHSPFNKLRMCVFPKRYPYNQNEPERYPYERNAGGGWDLSRFNSAFFRHLERRVADLGALGIEADLILFHPYDKGHWGFDQMDASSDERYLRYVVARLAAYRNVWWSLANEYDLLESKSVSDWDRLFQIVRDQDPYQHLRSVHNWHTFYDHTKPWVTHASIQTSVAYPDLEKVSDWREAYQKPIVIDETCYEGNIPFRWGNITPQEMVHRFWLGTALGGYVGHGETYLHPDDVLWWSKGGVLHGESPARIAFLKRVLADAPHNRLAPAPALTRDMRCVGIEPDYYLAYAGRGQPALAHFNLCEGHRYRAEIIDTWEMSIVPVDGLLCGPSQVALPGKPYIAVRLTRV